MSNLFRALPLFAVLLTACSEPVGWEGHWQVQSVRGSYATWDISNDTVHINRNGLYPSTGYLSLSEDGQYDVTTNRGVWTLIGDPATHEFQIEPAPGTGGDAKSVVRTSADPLADFYSNLSVHPNLPSASEFGRLKNRRMLHRIFLQPADPANTANGLDYIMQIGEEWHDGIVTQTADYVEFMRSHYSSEDEQNMVTLLYIDGSTKMQLVQRVKYELRSTNQYNVAYAVNSGRIGNTEVALRRNLFVLLSEENALIKNDTMSEASVQQMRDAVAVRGNFYTSLYTLPALHRIHINAENKIILGDVELDNDLYYAALKNVIFGYDQEERKPTFLFSFDDEATYAQYIFVLNTHFKVLSDLQDEYSLQAFKGKVADIDRNTKDGKAAYDFVMRKYPMKFVDLTKEAKRLFDPLEHPDSIPQ
jgi:hypothetical protein